MCVVSVGFSSFFNGLVVFTILGFMAKQSGLPVDEVAKASGRSKTFIEMKSVLTSLRSNQSHIIHNKHFTTFYLLQLSVKFSSEHLLLCISASLK